MLKLIVILIVICISWSIIIPSAKAEFCRQIKGHQVCIVKIKRSAKNYWEYRAAVKIDQEIRSIEIYDCRQRHRVTQEGDIIPFKSNGVGKLICRVLNK
ncbi:hypothetical protein [Crocosphaera chwakensis]|uniref:Uncharacterized protein n=1 Tax=Crocosphaera chwakensis CCY0110 TaxID=391612 RepID=A3IWC3_9CHRO|nr:hypothetical protein [Crocosphaera chwakensis]EAZ89236.1 hypothetical protein CY0110_06784 [Crocosphaera chwakensis CCY0110]